MENIDAPVCLQIEAFDMRTTERGKENEIFSRQNDAEDSASTNLKAQSITTTTTTDSIFVPVNRRIRFVCRVSADPTDLEFTWYLNNSQTGERRLLAKLNGEENRLRLNEGIQNNSTSSKAKISAGQSLSELIFAPLNHLDFGQIYCVAKNELGDQTNSCSLTIKQLKQDSGKFNPHFETWG